MTKHCFYTTKFSFEYMLLDTYWKLFIIFTPTGKCEGFLFCLLSIENIPERGFEL